MSTKRTRKHARHKLHHFSPLEVQAIFDARSRGVEIMALAKQYKVSRQSIYHAIRTIEDMKATTATGECNHDGDALPAKRRRSKRIPPEVEKEIADMKRKYPAWGVDYLREQWIKADHAPLSRASIYRILHDAGLQTRPLVEKETFQRFEMTHPGQLYQIDIQGEMYLDGIGWVYGFAILDDYSRFCAGFRYFTDAKLSNGVLLLHEAIGKHGVPDKMYTDHGSQFASSGERLNNFELFCAAYGIGITHTKVGRPQGRGKIERFYKTVKNQFITRVRAMIKETKEGQKYTLEQLNNDLDLYLQNEYNARVHGSTKETPAARFFKEPLRNLEPLVDVHKYLERGESRQVNDGVISFKGYKIQVSLPPKTEVMIVESIETIRVEKDGMLIREVNKRDLSKDLPVKRQDRTSPNERSPNERSSPGKQPVTMGDARELAMPASIVKTFSPRNSSDPGPDENGFYHRKVSPSGCFSWRHHEYVIGRARKGEEIRIQVVEDKLVVQDSAGNLVKTIEIRQDHVKKRGAKAPVLKYQDDIQANESLPTIEPSLAESCIDNPLEPQFLNQYGPDKDGFYHRTATTTGHFKWGGSRYSLGKSLASTKIRIKIVNDTLHVFDEGDNLLKTFKIKNMPKQ